MQHVYGPYCPEVEQPCQRWMDPPGRFGKYRCAQHGPSSCLSTQRTTMSFCIDRLEFTRGGESLPMVRTTWHQAQQLCGERGRRLCTESEWQFACEGVELRPYPYGFARDSSACNIDRQPTHVPGSRSLFDLRARSGSHPRCASPFGVLDLSGNVEEWVLNDRAERRYVSILKGAWWHPGRSHCRAAQIYHGPQYSGLEVGFRCCKGAEQAHSMP
ncbi:MAG: SUMF1/EgtB/PvdO family nonheme iron enzyme [Polyangiaceae bacterium]|nr:SUMF1/EgtB/PvdO family nonheme iron enzyme [Polyangiaceae bacterium]